MALILKIGFPPGSNLKYKLMKFKPSLSVKETIEEIVKTNKSTNAEQYVLLLPPPSPELNSLWLEEGRLLSSYPLQPKVPSLRSFLLTVLKDLVELRKKYQVIKIRFRRGHQRILIDINEKMEKILPLISKKFQLENIDDYSLYIRKTEVDMNKSVREQLISTDATYVLKMDNEEEMDGEEDYDEPEVADDEDEENKDEEPEEKVDIMNANPKQIKKPQKAGFINFKQNKKKKFEPKWFVLKDKDLIYCKTQNDKKPAGVIQVTQFKMKLYEPDEKEKKSKEYQHSFELYNDSETYIFKCEGENNLKSWMSAIETALGNEKQSNDTTGGIFGAPLSKAVPPGKTIPDVVEQCVKYIEQRSVDQEGIFRLSGSAVLIENYKKAIDRGEKVDLTKEGDPHCIAGLLKLYLRMLPEPLLTYSKYDAFLAAISAPNHNLRLRYIKNLVSSLPKQNIELLKYLFALLRKVNEHSKVNKMGIPNLATVFGPNLLVSQDASMITMVQDTPQINSIVSMLIEEYETIFLNKEMQEVVATALYDYDAQDETEISFKAGDTVKVLSQGDINDWWQGEINGAIGKFPGSYVKVEVKSRKEQFKEDMDNVKKKLAEETAQVKALTDSKAALEREIQQLQEEQRAFEQEVKKLKEYLSTILKEDKLENIKPRLEKYSYKLNAYLAARNKLEETRKGLMEDITALKVFLKNPPADTKKTLKPKSTEKLETQLGITLLKLNAEQKKRNVANERFDDLYKDLEPIKQLLLK